MMKLSDSVLKVAILGVGGVGKTDVVRLISGINGAIEYQTTINVDITNFDGTNIGLNR